MSSPSTPPRHRQLTRDERLQIQTLRLAGHTQKFIADLLGISRRQVGYAITTNCLTPSKRSGRPPHLTHEQVNELEAFVNETPANREMTYRQLAQGPFEHWGVSEYVIQRALRSRGVARHPERASHTSSGKMIKVKTSRDGLQAPMNGMQTTSETLPSSTHPIHTPLNTLQTRTESLPSSTHAVHAPMNALQAPMNLHAPMNNLQAPMNNMQAPMNNLQAPMNNLQAPMNNLQTSMNTLQSSMNTYQNSMDELQTPMNALQSSTENSLSTHTIPQASMYELQPQNDSLQTMRHSTQNPLDDMHSHAENIQAASYNMHIHTDSI